MAVRSFHHPQSLRQAIKKYNMARLPLTKLASQATLDRQNANKISIVIKAAFVKACEHLPGQNSQTPIPSIIHAECTEASVHASTGSTCPQPSEQMFFFPVDLSSLRGTSSKEI